MNTIIDVVNVIEEIAKENQLHTFGGLQRRRASFYNLKFKDHSLFSINENIVKDNYSYHYGGQKELQFNVGIQSLDDKEVFRFGVAFSIQSSRSFSNPIDGLRPLIERYNQYIELYPDTLKGLKSWAYMADSEEYKTLSVEDPIPDKIIQNGNFIFIGDYFNKSIEELSKREITTIVNLFDKLMPVYEAVVLENLFQAEDNRFIRLAWNTNKWEKPSGRKGKSKSKSTHEGKYGFGFEEWLFDKSKLIDGYMYGFLQPFHTKDKDTFKLTKRDVHLYTRNIHERFWVGEINDVEVLSDELAAYAYSVYQNKGWLKEREGNLLSENVESDVLRSNNLFMDDPTSMFNVRFKPESILIDREELIPMSDQDFKSINNDRYTAVKVSERIPNVDNSYGISTENINPTKEFRSVISRSSREETKEHKNSHDEIQVKFAEWLSEYLKPEILSVEHKTDDGRKLDIYVETKGRKIIFEVKSYNSLHSSVRVGLGQLIEYKYFPSHKHVDDIILVSNIEPTKLIIDYINHLNKQFNLNLGYAHFDEIKQELVKQIGITFYDYK